MVSTPLALVATTLSGNCSGGNGQGSVSDESFDAVEVLFRFILFFLLLALECEYAVDDLDVDVFGIDAGQVGLDGDLLIGLLDVDVRLKKFGGVAIAEQGAFRKSVEHIFQF